MITLHGLRVSGHSHRAELMLHLLDIPYEFRNVDLPNGEHKQPPFLKLNPLGQVPVIDDDGVIIPDSVAILVYLANKYDRARTWLPTDPVAASRVQCWLSVAQGALFNGPNKARLAKLFGRPVDHQLACQEAATLFQVLEAHLARRSWWAMPRPSPMWRSTVISPSPMKASCH